MDTLLLLLQLLCNGHVFSEITLRLIFGDWCRDIFYRPDALPVNSAGAGVRKESVLDRLDSLRVSRSLKNISEDGWSRFFFANQP